MHILWHRIIIFIVALVIVVLCVTHGHAVLNALSGLNRIGPGNSANDQTAGLITLGLIGAFLIALVRILTTPRN